MTKSELKDKIIKEQFVLIYSGRNISTYKHKESGLLLTIAPNNYMSISNSKDINGYYSYQITDEDFIKKFKNS